jgi:hypothetical protein
MLDAVKLDGLSDTGEDLTDGGSEESKNNDDNYSN